MTTLAKDTVSLFYCWAVTCIFVALLLSVTVTGFSVCLKMATVYFDSYFHLPIFFFFFFRDYLKLNKIIRAIYENATNNYSLRAMWRSKIKVHVWWQPSLGAELVLIPNPCVMRNNQCYYVFNITPVNTITNVTGKFAFYTGLL